MSLHKKLSIQAAGGEQHTVRGRARLLSLLIVALLTVMAALVSLSAPAEAKALAGVITGVTTTPATVVHRGTVTTDFTIKVPDGTQAGDTFTLTLPNQLSSYPSSLTLTDPTGQVVATASIVNGVATFTMTDYAATHHNVEGSGKFTANLNGNAVDGDNTLTYTTNDGTTFNNHVTVTPNPVVTRNGPYKYGVFTTPTDQCRTDGHDCIAWTVQSETGPFSSGTLTDKIGNTAAETIDCPANPVFQIGTPSSNPNSFKLTGLASYTGTVSFTCSASGFTWKFGAVPAGKVVQLTVPASAPAHPAGGVNFSNNVTGTTDVHPYPQSKTSYIVSASGSGRASGDNVTITKWSTSDGPTVGAFDTAPGKQVAPGTPVAITMTITNPGANPLTDVVVSDATSSGPALTGLSCNFAQAVAGAPTSGTSWAGPLPVGASFTCTGTVPAMAAGTQETDTATVTAKGYGPVSDTNPFNSYTPAPPTSTPPTSTPPTTAPPTSTPPTTTAPTTTPPTTPTSRLTPTPGPSMGIDAESAVRPPAQAAQVAQAAAQQQSLASTGVRTRSMIVIGLSLLALGALALAFARRRGDSTG
jgi:hypothetical protein